MTDFLILAAAITCIAFAAMLASGVVTNLRSPSGKRTSGKVELTGEELGFVVFGAALASAFLAGGLTLLGLG